MRSDPHPHDSVGRIGADRSVVETDAYRPEFADPLQVQRWMVRIGFEQLEISARELLDFGRKLIKITPVAPRCAMAHSNLGGLAAFPFSESLVA